LAAVQLQQKQKGAQLQFATCSGKFIGKYLFIFRIFCSPEALQGIIVNCLHETAILTKFFPYYRVLQCGYFGLKDNNINKSIN